MPDPTIHWLITAQQNLKEALAETLAQAGSNRRLLEHIQQASGLLKSTFPDANAVIVRDRLHGFSANSDLDVLLVEVVPATANYSSAPPSNTEDETKSGLREIEPAAYVVKLYLGTEDPAMLQRELDAWQTCRPRGLHDDSILTPLKAGTQDPKTGYPVSLVYGDAHSVLGTGSVMNLEEAFVDCCCFGIPTVESLIHGLHRLWSRMESRFYGQSYVPNSHTVLARHNKLRERVKDQLTTRWSDHLKPIRTEPVESGLTREERLRHRRETLGILAAKRDTFIDPCDYMKGLLKRPDDWPRVLHGCAHGDLHGRNVLVSVVDDQAGSLALFDYEDMRIDNLVGWDFVKMEVELKVRAFPEVLSKQFVEYVHEVHAFEVALAKRTEHFHDHGSDDPELHVPGGAAGERLALLALAIRQQAKRHLGELRNRPQEWLEEYYFLMACYGVYSIKFSTYGQRELIGSYISAGVAARRLDRPWQQFAAQIQAAQRAARAAMEDGSFNPQKMKKLAVEALREFWRQEDRVGRMSYHADLAFAQVWSRSSVSSTGVAEKRNFVKEAVDLMEKLRQKRYPHVSEFDEELALCFRRLGDDENSRRIVESHERRYRQGSEEWFCRLGADRKKAAVMSWPVTDGPMPGDTDREFRNALQYYEKAYAFRHDYYPGINVASLRRILGKDGVEGIAQAVYAATPPESQEPVWGPATQGEALLLCGKHNEAEDKYKSAATYKNCSAHAKEAMRTQIELLLRVMDQQTTEHWTLEKLDAIFGPR